VFNRQLLAGISGYGELVGASLSAVSRNFRLW
jgi:hypothetical protein